MDGKNPGELITYTIIMSNIPTERSSCTVSKAESPTRSNKSPAIYNDKKINYMNWYERK